MPLPFDSNGEIAVVVSMQHVLVHLGGDPQPSGEGRILVRLRYSDVKEINQAAAALGITQAEFARTVLIKAAQKINEEALLVGKDAIG